MDDGHVSVKSLIFTSLFNGDQTPTQLQSKDNIVKPMMTEVASSPPS